MIIRFEYVPDFFRPAKRERPPLDMDLLGLSMTTDYRRAEFLAQVERETEEAQRQHPPHATMTDHKWQDVVAILQRSAAEFYAQGPLKEQMDGYKGKHPQQKADRQKPSCAARHQQRGQPRGAESSRESRTHLLGNSRNSPVWHTVHAEDGTSTRKQPLRRNSWRRKGRVGWPLCTSCHGYCLGKTDQREDSTDLLRETKPLNSGKRSCPPQDTRAAWVLSRAPYTTSGQSGPAQLLVRRMKNDLSAPWPSASPRATS